MENPPPPQNTPLASPTLDGSNQNLSGIYLELPTHSRRHRSLHLSLSFSSTSQDEGIATSVLELDVEDVFEEEEHFDCPRLFTEMLSLSEEDETNQVWKEAARWVRFEEDVEVEGHRWSKPRVSALSLHSFFELHSILMNGTVVLDIEGNSIEEIFMNTVNQVAWINRLSFDDVIKIVDTLKNKCVHLFEVMKNNQAFIEKGNCSINTLLNHQSAAASNRTEEENETVKNNKQFLKKLPEGAEAANILVGEVQYLKKQICFLIRLKNAVNLGSLTEVSLPTRFIFLLLGPMGNLQRFEQIGRSMGTLLSDEVFRDVAYKGQTKLDLMNGMDEFLDASTLLPPGEWDPNIRIEPPEIAPTKITRSKNKDILEEEERKLEMKHREEAGLSRSGRFFGGLFRDIQRKQTYYISDFKDGFNLNALATFFFLYFACLTPLVTFGGLLGDATKNNIAVIETLASGLICGVLYGFLSGQPLTLLGSTGPVLVFESILFEFCDSQGWNYLSFRLWVGLWVAAMLLCLVAVDASALVCYITKFTAENFATLVALIFIYKALESIFEIKEKYPVQLNVNKQKFCQRYIAEPVNSTLVINSSTYFDFTEMNDTMIEESCQMYYPDIFLLSFILFMGTFLISMTLKSFKSRNFFPAKIRRFISDFAVIIAIVAMTLVDFELGINTPKLEIPTEFQPTLESRGWLAYPFNGNPWWTSIVACVPALLACILIFMDQQITAVIVNKKEHKLKKGCGYHLDLFVLSFLVTINSVLGLPWFVADTVLSTTHVNSLKMEKECLAPGEKPQFDGVRENRLTQILIYSTIGFSVMMTPLLQKIPMAVLFGVFLYMGIAALMENELVERIFLSCMPDKYQPDRAFLKKVPLQRVHLYTCIQLVCLAVLWIIKSFKETSILFALMLVVMVGIRKLLDSVFSQSELRVLDEILPKKI